MIVRTFNYNQFNNHVKHFITSDTRGFDAEELVSDFFNILLFDCKDNYALFEYSDDGVYYGHYFFNSARGKEAINTAKNMLKSLKKFDPNIKSVRGLIAEDNKKAIWITRKLGFEYLFTQQTQIGPMQVYNLRLEENYE